MFLSFADDSFSRLQLENIFLQKAMINLKLLFEYKCVWKGERGVLYEALWVLKWSRKVLYENQYAKADKWSKTCFSSFYWSSL